MAAVTLALVNPTVAPGVNAPDYARFVWCNCAGCTTVAKPVITQDDYMSEGHYFDSATATLEHLWFHCPRMILQRDHDPVRSTDVCRVLQAKRAAGTVNACGECAHRRRDWAKLKEITRLNM